MEDKNNTRLVLNKKFTHEKLKNFAKEKLKIEDPNKFKLKKDLVNHIIENKGSKEIDKLLNPSGFQIWWDKNHNRFLNLVGIILGLASVILGIYAILPPDEMIIKGKVLNLGEPLIGANITLPKINTANVKTDNYGEFIFSSIPSKRLPQDSIEIQVESKYLEKTNIISIPKRDCFNNVIIEINESQSILLDSTKFSILILPFQLLKDCTSPPSAIEATISTRLNDMAEIDSLNLEAKFLNSGIGCSKTYNQVKEIGKKYNANLVVWGDLYGQCFSDSMNSCLKYVIIDSPIKNIDKNGKTKITQHIMSDIGRGELQYDVDYIIYYSLALWAGNKKDHKLAIKHCNKIIEDVNSNSPSVLVTKGYHLYKIGDTLNTQLCFEKAIELDSTKGGSYMNLAILYDDQKEYDLAENYFQKAIHFEPTNPQIHSNYGNFHRGQKQYIKAELELLKSIALDSSHVAAYVGLGNLSLTKSSQIEARNYYKKGLEINPYFKEAHIFRHNMGYSYLKENKLDSAEVYFQINIELNPDFSNSYFSLGQVNLERGCIKDAQDLYLKYCEIAPEWKLPKFDSLFQLAPNS